MTDQPRSDEPGSRAPQRGELAAGQIIAAPQELTERCLRPGNASLAALEAIARAEAALEELSVNFEDWMKAETGRLTTARAMLCQNRESPEAVDALFEAAHDLKGQAGTLGYPIAADICGTLCRLLEAVGDQHVHLPLELVDHHVDAVNAIVREGAKGADNDTAIALSERLRRVTESYLSRKGGPESGAAA